MRLINDWPSSFFHSYEVLLAEQFDEVDWKHVSYTLTDCVPRLFQVWACKQTMNIAGTNAFLSHQDGRDKHCPCCTVAIETTGHILFCQEEGRVEAFDLSAKALKNWMVASHTDPDLIYCIMEYVLDRGETLMEDIVRELPHRYRRIGHSQDTIGWRRFLEGMISKQFAPLQQQYLTTQGSRLSIEAWASGLVTRLLEITHGQWLYRNYTVHDGIAGTAATARKEEIQKEIERQQELGDEGLLTEDMFLAEVNLEDMEASSGAQQEYWLLAIKAARKAKLLRDRQGDTDIRSAVDTP